MFGVSTIFFYVFEMFRMLSKAAFIWPKMCHIEDAVFIYKYIYIKTHNNHLLAAPDDFDFNVASWSATT